MLDRFAYPCKGYFKSVLKQQQQQLFPWARCTTDWVSQQRIQMQATLSDNVQNLCPHDLSMSAHQLDLEEQGKRE